MAVAVLLLVGQKIVGPNDFITSLAWYRHSTE